MKRMVYVRWIDSQSHAGTWSQRDDHEVSSMAEMECETVAWQVAENEHAIGLAMSLGCGQYGLCFDIPKCAVLELKELGNA